MEAYESFDRNCQNERGPAHNRLTGPCICHCLVCLPLSRRYGGFIDQADRFDIHTSIMFQTNSAFPLFMPSSLVITSWPTSQPGSPASQKSPALATGFNSSRRRSCLRPLTCLMFYAVFTT